MDLNFYPGKKGKVMGLLMASPEEFQTYAAALMDVPEGCVLTARIRSVQVGKGSAEKRREILIGAATIGEPLALDGEQAKALPPSPAPKALEIPQGVHDAKDDALEVMAARNGCKVTDAWRRRSRSMREADVAKAMSEKRETAPAVA